MARAFEPFLARLSESLRKAVTESLRSGSWIKVRQALNEFEHSPGELQGPEVSVQILSSFSADVIESALRLGLRCMPCRPTLSFTPLDTIEQQLLDHSSAAYQSNCLANVVLWRIEEILPSVYYPFSGGGYKENLRRCCGLQERITNMVKAYLELGSAPLFLSTLPVPPRFADSILDSQMGSGVSSTVGRINGTIFESALLDSRIKVLDVNRWSAQEGSGYYDAQMDFMGRQPLTVSASISLGLFLARNLRPLLFPRRKVLAVDLDNTLWGGVLGEDGAQNLKIGRDFPGNVFLRIQQEILELRHRGVLLVILSKNEKVEAQHAIQSMPEMLLKWDDFVCHKVSFGHKYIGLREASEELGLAMSSFAFLDDSGFEREQMKLFNPEVLILNDHNGALHMLESLVQSDAFEAHDVSEEDQRRHEDYVLRSARSYKEDTGRVEDFLASLRLCAKVEPVSAANIDRVVQMLGKTNQFNLTTKRHGLNELRRILHTVGAVSLALRLVDKFGDQGIVGVLLAVPQAEAKVLEVDSFLVSCRAIGRGVEDVLWASLLNCAARNGIQRIVGRYLRTPKNGLVASLYERLGLRRLGESESGVQYLLETVKPACPPAWITVEEVGL